MRLFSSYSLQVGLLLLCGWSGNSPAVLAMGSSGVLAVGSGGGAFFGGTKDDSTNTDRRSHLYSMGVPIMTSPFDDVDARERGWQENMVPLFSSLATMSYGTALLIHGLEGAKGQIRTVSMLRATGHEKLVNMFRTTRQNIRDAAFAALWRAPSFVMAHRSLTQLDENIQRQRAAIKAAKADGKITKREARKLKIEKKRYIRQLQKDMKRVARASGDLQEVINAFDFDEIMDLARAFMFQLLAVLSAGDEDRKTSGLGILVGKWCLFLNLGGLVAEATEKCGDPFYKAMCRPEKVEGARNAGKAVAFGSSGFLVLRRNIVARRLNAAFLSSAVFLRGLRNFVQTMLDWDDDDDDGPWPFISRALDGFTGGVLLVSLAVSAWKSHRQRREEAEVGTPLITNLSRWNIVLEYTKVPLSLLEEVIECVADEMDKIV